VKLGTGTVNLTGGKRKIWGYGESEIGISGVGERQSTNALEGLLKVEGPFVQRDRR